MIRDTLYKSDVVQDFLKFALGTEDFTVTESPNTNESVSLENLAILREMHAALRPAEGPRGDLEPAYCRYVARQMNLATGIKGTKVQYHRSLADKMAVDLAADAQALDAAFFTGTPMMDALTAAPAKAVDQPQSLRIEDHYSDREQYLIRLWVNQTGTFLKQDPDAWAQMLRIEERQRIMGLTDHAGDTPAPEPEPQAENPRRRRRAAGLGAGPGRKGIGRGAGKAGPKADAETPKGAGRPGRRKGPKPA